MLQQLEERAKQLEKVKPSNSVEGYLVVSYVIDSLNTIKKLMGEVTNLKTEIVKLTPKKEGKK